MNLTPEDIKSFVESLTDSHGFHFKIGKILATAIVNQALLNPLHGDTDYTARILATITTYESSNRVNIKGDGGKSYCAMQVQKFYGYNPEDLLKDAAKCIEVGLKILHESEDMCPDYPLAPYAAGNCNSKAGRVISDNRVKMATIIVGD